MKIGDKIKWFNISEGWQKGTLLSYPKDAYDPTALVLSDSGIRGYIDFSRIENND